MPVGHVKTAPSITLHTGQGERDTGGEADRHSRFEKERDRDRSTEAQDLKVNTDSKTDRKSGLLMLILNLNPNTYYTTLFCVSRFVRTRQQLQL